MIINRKLIILAALILSILSKIANAEIGDIPIIGGIYNSTVVIKEHIVNDIELTALTARDLSLYTVGGLSLDAYILTLPLDAKVKANVIKRLAHPQYAIGLGRFIYHFYNQYTQTTSIKSFKQHLTDVYSAEQLVQYQHSLFQLNETKSAKDNKAKSSTENKQLIAAFVTIYDLLFNNDDWQMDKALPTNYHYLSNTVKDLKVISQVQPIIINLMKDFAKTLDNGDAKNALHGIIADNDAKFANKVNNKAQAITVSLIDFVRLNVLKGYRQYALKLQRVEKFDDWMRDTFANDPQQLILFLQHQNNKRFAVQIAVDGLQQGLVNALVQDNANAFIKQVNENITNSAKYQPQNEATTIPGHQQQLDYLQAITTGKEPDKHYLPFFKSIYQSYSKSIAEFGISSTPTISVRNLPIILTGANVANKGGTGIPNFHFVDRSIDRGYYFFGNDALQLERLIENNKVQTMFDRLSYLKTLNCNGQYDWNAQLSYDGLVNLAVGEFIRDYGELRCVRELAQRAIVEKQVIKARNELVELIKQYQQLSYWTPFTKISKKQLVKGKISHIAKLNEAAMPDFVLMYVPWPDHFAHFKGPFSDEIIAPTGELNRLDYWLGQLQKVYKDAGVYKNTLWGMAGDHGLAQVFYTLNPEVQVFEALEKDLNIKLNIEKISSDEGEGPKITNALNYPSFKQADVVVASTAGGNYMMDFFNSKQGWQYQPIYQELKHWQPLSNTNIEIDIVKEISNRLKETLDYLVVREHSCAIDKCHIRIVGHRNGKRLDEIIIHKNGRIFYGLPANAVLKNERLSPQLLDLDKDNPYSDPLSREERQEKSLLITQCLNLAKIESPNTWCTSAQWRQLTRLTPRPDSLNQLAHLYDEDRAGTVNLFPKEGIGYNTKVPGRHAGEHYLEKDAFIGFWGTPAAQSIQLKSVANGSLAPTIYEYLTREKVTTNEDGWGFSSLLKQVQNTEQD